MLIHNKKLLFDTTLAYMNAYSACSFLSKRTLDIAIAAMVVREMCEVVFLRL